MTAFALAGHGITVSEIYRNLSPGALYEHAIRFEKDASIAENGALGLPTVTNVSGLTA
jgi:phosphoenolpyruvate carboxykinase (ATP)